jgi:hypothetical protein
MEVEVLASALASTDKDLTHGLTLMVSRNQSRLMINQWPPLNTHGNILVKMVFKSHDNNGTKSDEGLVRLCTH